MDGLDKLFQAKYSYLQVLSKHCLVLKVKICESLFYLGDSINDKKMFLEARSLRPIALRIPWIS